MTIKIPEHFFEVQYAGSQYPGLATGLERGANCQHFCYELLRHFGFKIANMRSSDLSEDNEYTSTVHDLRPFDLILFNRSSAAFGAHVGICVGDDAIIHLSKSIGKPIIWGMGQFEKVREYRSVVKIKRPRSNNSIICSVGNVLYGS
jgi:hypothetical protein